MRSTDASFFDGEPKSGGLPKAIRFMIWATTTVVMEIARFVLLLILFFPTFLNRPIGCIGVLISLYGLSLPHNTMLMKSEWGALLAVSAIILVILPRIYFRIRNTQFRGFDG